MLNFIIYTTVLVLLNSLRSARSYQNFKKIFDNLKFYKFRKEGEMIIANERAKDEFIVFPGPKFKLSQDKFLHFDIWMLADFHELYWFLKFRNYFKNKGIANGPYIFFL